MMSRRTRWWQRGIAGSTAVALVLVQVTLPSMAEASPVGSATASAGSAPPPSVSAIQSFQPDLFTGRATTSIPIAVPPGQRRLAARQFGCCGIGEEQDVARDPTEQIVEDRQTARQDLGPFGAQELEPMADRIQARAIHDEHLGKPLAQRPQPRGVGGPGLREEAARERLVRRLEQMRPQCNAPHFSSRS
jgi:hypothetical protein